MSMEEKIKAYQEDRARYERESRVQFANTDIESPIVYFVFKKGRAKDENGVWWDVIDLVPRRIIISKDVKFRIWEGISYALSEGRFGPFTILVPKKFITKKKFPYEETPIPFLDHTFYVVPNIKEVIVLDQT